MIYLFWKTYGETMRNISYIYKIKCSKNDKYYIGSSNNPIRRWVDHLKALRKGIHTNLLFQDTFQKYGEDSLEFEILEVCPKHLQFRVETQYLQFVKKTDINNSLNKVFHGKGSEKGTPKSEEHKRKISDSNKKRSQVVKTV